MCVCVRVLLCENENENGRGSMIGGLRRVGGGGRG